MDKHLTVSSKTAGMMKGVGLELDTEFYWCYDEERGWYIQDEPTEERCYPAPTFAEILVRLPGEIERVEGEPRKLEVVNNADEKYLIGYAATNIKQVGNNPVEPAGQLLIWAKRNGYIDDNDNQS